ncbi:GNAT family N-acetyltransferase [Puniceicoccaceae bacterium K14]|nr:GNAT family N-acetyltransferase [Puniceicoccaceae bacterium K14]
MKALRPHLDPAAFTEKVKRQQGDGYQLACVVNDAGDVSAIAGYRIHETMAWGKILYLDDLATSPEKLRKGYAGALLDWLHDEAIAAQCDQMHLDSGYNRNDAHRLYLNKGYQLVSHHFAKIV